jgi:hypothetical protein
VYKKLLFSKMDNFKIDWESVGKFGEKDESGYGKTKICRGIAAMGERLSNGNLGKNDRELGSSRGYHSQPTRASIKLQQFEKTNASQGNGYNWQSKSKKYWYLAFKKEEANNRKNISKIERYKRKLDLVREEAKKCSRYGNSPREKPSTYPKCQLG